MDIQKEVDFFDRFGAEHGDYDVLADSTYARILSMMRTRLNPQAGMSCIDLGCGTGAFTRRLGAFDLALTGVDISPGLIARGRERGGATFIVGDICDSPAEAASFDFAVMSGVLHHLPTEDVRLRSLREAYRLLKPGGQFFSYDPNAWSPSMFLYRDPRSPFYSPDGKTDNEVLLTRGEISNNLRAAGFDGIRVTGLSGIAYTFVEGRRARQLLPFYNHVYENLMRLPLLQDVMGTFLIATATKPPG
jgi:SAM-dependent methyltransferase